MPDDVLQMVRRGKAMSQTLIEMLYFSLTGQSLDPGTLEPLFEEKLNNLPEQVFDQKFRWFLTFMIEKHVDVDDSEISPDRFQWITPEQADQVAKDFQSHASTAFDLLAPYSTIAINPLFLEDLLVDDQVFILAEGRQPLRWPFWRAVGGEAELSLGYPELDVGRLDAVLGAAAKLSTQQRSWLESSSYWYLRTLRERDPWKQFVWGFAALEILCNKVARTHYNNVIDSLARNASNASQQETSRAAIARLIGQDSVERVSLVSRFATMALALSLETATEDVDKFARVKKIRDKISHGERIREEDLARGQCRELLERYMTRAMEWQLGLNRSPLIASQRHSSGDEELARRDKV
jgi:hypothetical protein